MFGDKEKKELELIGLDVTHLYGSLSKAFAHEAQRIQEELAEIEKEEDGIPKIMKKLVKVEVQMAMVRIRDEFRNLRMVDRRTES